MAQDRPSCFSVRVFLLPINQPTKGRLLRWKAPQKSLILVLLYHPLGEGIIHLGSGDCNI